MAKHPSSQKLSICLRHLLWSSGHIGTPARWANIYSAAEDRILCLQSTGHTFFKQNTLGIILPLLYATTLRDPILCDMQCWRTPGLCTPGRLTDSFGWFNGTNRRGTSPLYLNESQPVHHYFFHFVCLVPSATISESAGDISVSMVPGLHSASVGVSHWDSWVTCGSGMWNAN